MKDIEILEINEIGDYEEDLTLLLEDSVNNGASIGFLAPIEKNEVVNYWREVKHKLDKVIAVYGLLYTKEKL